MKLMTVGSAGKILIVLLALLMVMHVLLLLKVIPHDVVWGGNISDISRLLVFEISALVINGLFLIVVAIRLEFLKVAKLKRAAGVGMWVVFAYFGMNVIGNLTSGVSLERYLFAPLSIIVTLLALAVAAARQAP